jgi:transcriptional regulator with XRE-family HTH domain
MSKTIGQRIRELREQRGLTQDELAKQLGCAQTTVAEWENRKDRLPGGKLLGDIAKVFGISVDYLLNPALKNPRIPCYGEVCCQEFKWPDKENEYFIDVPQNEYNDNRFALKILDDKLEPLAYKSDYCIWQLSAPEDGDIVVVRFPAKGDLAWIRMWRQDDKSVVLAETSIDKYCPPYFFEITQAPDSSFSYVASQKGSKEIVVVEGKLVAVKRMLKSIRYSDKINYIFA